MVKGVPIAIRSAVISNRLQLLSGTDIPVAPVTKKYLTVKESFKKRLPGDKTPEPERISKRIGMEKNCYISAIAFSEVTHYRHSLRSKTGPVVQI